MALYTLDDIRSRVLEAVCSYNGACCADERIVAVALFGSYATKTSGLSSDIDLLVTFSSDRVGIFALARLLEICEGLFDTEVDIVQEPLPEGSLLEIGEKVPLYEAA